MAENEELEQQAVERLLEDEQLRGELTDFGFEPLLKWGTDAISAFVGSHQGTLAEQEMDDFTSKIRNAISNVVEMASSGNLNDTEALAKLDLPAEQKEALIAQVKDFKPSDDPDANAEGLAAILQNALQQTGVQAQAQTTLAETAPPHTEQTVAPEVKSEAEPETEAKPAVAPEAVTKPETEAEAKPEVKSEIKPQAEAKSEASSAVPTSAIQVIAEALQKADNLPVTSEPNAPTQPAVEKAATPVTPETVETEETTQNGLNKFFSSVRKLFGGQNDDKEAEKDK